MNKFCYSLIDDNMMSYENMIRDGNIYRGENEGHGNGEAGVFEEQVVCEF